MDINELLKAELEVDRPATARESVLRAIDGGEERQGLEAPEDWESWVRAVYPDEVGADFADHHREAWDWGWDIQADAEEVDPLVLILSRGGAKSSTAELLVAACGLTGRRRYAWYVRGTQERANDSLSNIATLLEADSVERHYPQHASRELSKYGHSKSWKSERLRTAGGLVVDAIGLDTARRGLKVGNKRPDLIVLDDLDEKHDTPDTTARKYRTLTHSVLPAGTGGTAVLAVQNLIIPGGIFTQLSDGRADCLAKRRVVGPVPALVGLKTEVVERDDGRKFSRIIGGTPTWAGQDVAECQRLMNLIGLRAFRQECQHDVKEREGALWTLDGIRYCGEVPALKRVVVGVDPSGGGDAIGIVVVGLGYDGRGYVLADYTVPGSVGPKSWGLSVVAAYDDYQADLIVAEKNFGGNLVESNILATAKDRRLPVKLVSASRGKAVRAEPVATLYGNGEVDHVAAFNELEGEMVQWVPGDPGSPNHMDALVWALTELMLQEAVQVGAWFPGMEEAEEVQAAPRIGRVAIAGGPGSGKSSMARKLGNGSARSTDDVMDLGWSQASEEAARWFSEPGELLVEGVAVPRALRKWLQVNPTGRPVDRLIYLDLAHIERTPDQDAMAKGVLTVMLEIVEELEERGVHIEWVEA